MVTTDVCSPSGCWAGLAGVSYETRVCPARCTARGDPPAEDRTVCDPDILCSALGSQEPASKAILRLLQQHVELMGGIALMYTAPGGPPY